MDFKSILALLIISLVSVQSVTVEEEVKNSTTFTFDFYRSSFNANVNTVISPISFRILLSLLYQSTVGDTSKELQNHVYLAHNKVETAHSQRLTLDALIANPTVKIVNKVYVRQGLTLKPSFAESATHYHSSVEQKDFSKSQQTANEINQFVEEQTNSLIKNLVSADIFKSSTVILLLNTLYFKADWDSPFPNHKVRKHNFNGIEGNRNGIDFMVASRSYRTLRCTRTNSMILELLYTQGSNAKFWIILPNQDSNIIELKDHLNAFALKEINEKLSHEYNEVWIPKFEIETTVDGVSELRKLGLNSMFDKAEIIALENESKLQVSDAKQKVKIIVNTKGTEAAVASYIGISRTSLMLSDKQPIKFDRPFVYMILTADTNEPLFVGHFSKPN